VMWEPCPRSPAALFSPDVRELNSVRQRLDREVDGATALAPKQSTRIGDGAAGLAARWPEDDLDRRGSAAPFVGSSFPEALSLTRFKHGPHDKQYLGNNQQRHQLGSQSPGLAAYNEVDPSMVRGHSSGFGTRAAEQARSSGNPHKLSNWLRPPVHAGHSFGRFGMVAYKPPRGETQSEQIVRFIKIGGLRSTAAEPPMLGRSTSQPSLPPTWVSRLHDKNSRRGSAGRTQAEQILHFERYGGLRAVEEKLGKSMTAGDNRLAQDRSVPQYLKTARVHTAPVFGQRVEANKNHLSSSALPPRDRFPRIIVQEDSWGVYSSRVFQPKDPPAFP